MKVQGSSDSPDMPQFLAALDKTVALLTCLQSRVPQQEDVEEALRTHVNMLVMFCKITCQRMTFAARTRAQGEALTDLMQRLVGADSTIAQHAKELGESASQTNKRDIELLLSVEDQIVRLKGILGDFRAEDSLAPAVSRQVEILRELPRLFPPGAPFRQTLARRTRLIR